MFRSNQPLVRFLQPTIVVLGLLAVCLLPLTAAASTYNTVDYQVSPGNPAYPMKLTAFSGSYSGNLWTYSLDATNTSATQTLQDVRYIQQFDWDFRTQPLDGPAFAWNNGAQQWQLPAWTLSAANPDGYMSMSPANVNTPSSWTQNSYTATVSATDSLPAWYLGTFTPGQTKTFTVKITSTGSASDYIDNVGFFVAVPEPSTFALLGAGALGLVALVYRRKRRV